MYEDIVFSLIEITHCRDDYLIIDCLLSCLRKIVVPDCGDHRIKPGQLKSGIIGSIADMMT